MNTVTQIDSSVNDLLKNNYATGALKLAGIIYAAMFAPQLPSGAKAVVNNSMFKLVAIGLIAYLAPKDFQLALVLTIALVASLNFNLKEMFSNFEKKPIDTSKLLEPKTAVYPGCHDIKMKDLLDAFSGDNMKLQDAVKYVFYDLMSRESATSEADKRLLKYARIAGLPYNVELIDENAPLIATMLLQYGYKFSDSCKVPQ
jgi:hypothetical protein